MSPRFIAHLDMDAFYASVELLRFPELRGKPLVIGGRRRIPADGESEAAPPTLRDYTGRGVITTATYEARAFGVHSGMGLMKAAKLAPGALLLPADFDEYRRYSRLFKDAVRALAPQIEDRGIDEIYIDLTGLVLPHPRPFSRGEKGADNEPLSLRERDGLRPPLWANNQPLSLPERDGLRPSLWANNEPLSLRERGRGEGRFYDDAKDLWQRARTIAATIQAAVRAATGLSCSIGVTPNKLLSKVASELDKPGGLTILTEADIGERLWPLPARKLNGVGPKANARLEALGIRTVGDLATADRALLIEHFGKSYGAWMHEAANGRDERPVVTHSEPKSISRETTFENDLHPVRDRDRLSRIFTELCVRVAEDLRRKDCLGRTIGLKLRYDNFKTVTRDCTLAEPTRDAAAIRGAAGACLKRVPLDRRIRLLGVRVGSLSRPGAEPARAAPAPAVQSAALF